MLKCNNIQAKETQIGKILNLSLHKLAPSFLSVIKLIPQHKVPEFRFKLKPDQGRKVLEKPFFPKKEYKLFFKRCK